MATIESTHQQELVSGTSAEVAEVSTLDPRISRSLHRLDAMTSHLADSYFQTAKELTNKASVLQDQLSEAIDKGVALNDNLAEANTTLTVAIETEAECRSLREQAQARFDEAEERKVKFLGAGKAPFDELAEEAIEDESDVSEAIQQFREQLLTILSITEPTEEGGESVLAEFFKDYLNAQSDLKEKVINHEESKKTLVLAQDDVAFFESGIVALESEIEVLHTRLSKMQQRHDTGRKHINGERRHQVIIDGLSNWAIVSAFRTGTVTDADLRQLEGKA